MHFLWLQVCGWFIKLGPTWKFPPTFSETYGLNCSVKTEDWAASSWTFSWVSCAKYKILSMQTWHTWLWEMIHELTFTNKRLRLMLANVYFHEYGVLQCDRCQNVFFCFFWWTQLNSFVFFCFFFGNTAMINLILGILTDRFLAEYFHSDHKTLTHV